MVEWMSCVNDDNFFFSFKKEILHMYAFETFFFLLDRECFWTKLCVFGCCCTMTTGFKEALSKCSLISTVLWFNLMRSEGWPIHLPAPTIPNSDHVHHFEWCHYKKCRCILVIYHRNWQKCFICTFHLHASTFILLTLGPRQLLATVKNQT